jgi:hypothetical protein
MKMNEMNKIFSYRDFTQDTLWVFDLDDTLVNTPSFESRAIEYLTESSNIEKMLNHSVSIIGRSLSDLCIENGRIYIEDPQNLFKNYGVWIKKGNRLYLTAPEEFSTSDISIPTSVREDIISIYKNSKNKSIVTARSEEMRPKIEKCLLDLGIEYPNFGLHMYPYKSYSKVAIWKSEKIIQLSKDFNFMKVKFFEDNQKWIRDIRKQVHNKYPSLDFEAFKV